MHLGAWTLPIAPLLCLIILPRDPLLLTSSSINGHCVLFKSLMSFRISLSPLSLAEDVDSLSSVSFPSLLQMTGRSSMAVVWGTPLGHAATKGTLWAVELCSLETTFWTVRVSEVGQQPDYSGQ